MLCGMGGFDGRVQSQQICLIGDVINYANNAANLIRALAELL